MKSITDELQAARQYYEKLGSDTIPLIAGKKQTNINDWTNKSRKDAWANAQEDSNIGIRCGGKKHLAVVGWVRSLNPSKK